MSQVKELRIYNLQEGNGNKYSPQNNKISVTAGADCYDKKQRIQRVYIVIMDEQCIPVPSLHGLKRNEPSYAMITSQNGNIFRVTGLCAGNSLVTGEFPHKGQWRGALMFYLICAWTNGWVNNGDAGDLTHHHAHYYVTLMYSLRNCIYFFLIGLIIFGRKMFTLQNAIRSVALKSAFEISSNKLLI